MMAACFAVDGWTIDNFENEDFLYEAPGYRHMLVVGNRPTDRVRFYQANFEHASSEANMEVRDAHNVEIFVSYTFMCLSFQNIDAASSSANI